MTRVPQEILDSIVKEVEDVKSLKACSLAGSAFRFQSQRILLRSLKLKAAPSKERKLGAVLAFLKESPHVVAYITIVRVYIPATTAAAGELENLILVLGLLTNVRRCALMGTSVGSFYDWNDVSAQLSSAIISFLARQPLHTLNVGNIADVPISTFCAMLTAASTVNFTMFCVEKDLETPSVPSGSTVKELGIKFASESLLPVLANPGFWPYIATLHYLTIPVIHMIGYGHAWALVSSAANTLERIQFEYQPRAFPRLPQLQRVEFTMLLVDCATSWFRDTIIFMLDPHSSPALSEVVVTFRSGQPPKTDFVEATLLAALDDALMAHPAFPCLKWRISFPEAFNDFASVVRHGMAKVHAQERVLVEIGEREDLY
ncbi:hypothetical protein B0H19DRAFT_1077819 [Mycena capillaripes]|nr:hypothetical protein B0H19DRAFT_1077819 [Mycena capillaripes]